MIANRELGFDDYLAMARRRIKLIVIPSLLAPLVGFLISYALTPKYTSKALLLVEGQMVPAGYVKPIVTERVSDRMITLEQNVLSRSRLQPLVERLGLARKGKTVDDWIEEIRDNLQVTEANLGKAPTEPGVAKGPGGTADVSGFYVSFTTRDPRDAQQVCSEIASMLLAANLELREQVARSTTDFLSRQLDQSKHNLDELDSKLSAFKQEHIGRLPGDVDSNLKILASLDSQLDAITQTISRAQQDKSYAEQMVSEELQVWKASQASPNYSTLREQLIKLQDQLVVLQSRYTEDYPDVVKTKHEIARLKDTLNAINSDPEKSGLSKDASVPKAGPKLDPPEVLRLRDQIHRDEMVMEHATGEQKRVEGQINLYQSRLAVSPEIEDEYKQLTRDNTTAHNMYDQLLTNENTAEMQTEMERYQEGEQLKLLDPASLPDSPSFPIRWMFAAYGLGCGLGLGLLAAFWLEFRDKSIKDEGDVLAALELPMLGSVPWLGTAEDGKSKFRGRFLPRLEEERTTGT